RRTGSSWRSRRRTRPRTILRCTSDGTAAGRRAVTSAFDFRFAVRVVRQPERVAIGSSDFLCSVREKSICRDGGDCWLRLTGGVLAIPVESCRRRRHHEAFLSGWGEPRGTGGGECGIAHLLFLSQCLYVVIVRGPYAPGICLPQRGDRFVLGVERSEEGRAARLFL
ncbi:unnamed protein product, partial [Phaeothamnion confervicola]